MRRLFRLSVLLVFLGTISVSTVAALDVHRPQPLRGGSSTSTAGDPKTVGIGVILGQPTGLSAKLWLSPEAAFDAAAAWSFVAGGALYAHVDYLQHFYNIFPVTVGALPLYVGIGAKVTAAQIPQLGIRIPVGIDYLFQNAPIGLFAEVAFGIDLFPATTVDGGGGIGIRYYF